MTSDKQRIDAHHHLWDVSRRAYPWLNGDWAEPLRRTFGVAELAEVTAPHGVRATVVVQAVSAIDETRELLAIAASTPLIAGVVGWVDLTAGTVAEQLAALRLGPGGDKLVGIRHQAQDEPDDRWLLRAEVLRGLRAVGAANLVYDLLVTQRELAAAIEVSAALPEVSFVLDHLGKPAIGGPMAPWSAAIGALADRPNVVAKISGLVTEADWRTWTPGQLAPYIERAVAAFGPDRLMFGSDWPVCTLAATYPEVLEAAEAALASLSPDERQQIFAGTAVRVYGLPATV